MLTVCRAQHILLDYRYHPHVTTVTIPMYWRGSFLPGLSQFWDPDLRCECQAFQAHFAYEWTEALQPSCLCLTF